MKCDKCGTELLKGNTIEAATDVVHSDSRCIDAIRAQLATMTKRAGDAERNAQSFEDLNAEDLRILREAMTAAGIEYAGPQDAYSIARHFTLALFAAEAKLATAVGLLKDVLALHGHPRIADSMNRFYEWRLLISQIRALGIDPSKEQGK